MGFSTMQCLPAAAAFNTTSWCRLLGVATVMMSISSRAMKASISSAPVAFSSGVISFPRPAAVVHDAGRLGAGKRTYRRQVYRDDHAA